MEGARCQCGGPRRLFLNDPRCFPVWQDSVATIRFVSPDSGHDTGEVLLPCQNWDDTAKGFLYRDPELDDGPCRLVKISTGQGIKAICLGKGAAEFPYDLTPGTDEGSINVVLSLGGIRYCTTFGDFKGRDGSDGKRFIGKSAPPPAACPPLPTTTTTTTTSTTLGGSAAAAFVDAVSAGALAP